MPDCFRGETLETNPDILQWLKKYPIDTVMRDIKFCQEYIETKCARMDDDNNGSNNNNHLELNYSSIGFCWGGWAIAKSAAEGVTWKSSVSCHPSTKIESFVFGNDEKSMMKRINMPFLLLPAGNDPDNLKPGSEAVEDLKRYGGNSILFENMVHGWVSRGDLSQDDVKADAEKALTFALDFLEENNTNATK